MGHSFDRELSALEFNARVLAEAKDTTLPLLERLKFAGIVSSNLDEFFMVRIASLQDSPERLTAVRERARALFTDLHRTFVEDILPELGKAGFARLRPETCTPQQLEYLKSYFFDEVLPVLTPIAFSQDRPLATLANLRMHMAVTLKDPKAAEVRRYAVVEIPQQNYPRLKFLPGQSEYSFVLLEDLILFYAADLFKGCEILEKGLMRLTRAAEMTLNEGNDEDFLNVMSEALQERRTAHVMRLEISEPQEWTTFIQKALAITPGDLFVCHDWMDLKGISQLAFQPGFEALKRPTWEPRSRPDFEDTDDLWALLHARPHLLFHPYESFDPVIQFLETAAADPDVLAIKQTLYRTEPGSAVLRALERAAENGKRVTVLVELKARFDEKNNIEWAKRLIHRGASVLYGIAGYKTHAKACLVIRREQEGIRRYVHLGTGNYNARTASLYSDISYFSSDELLTSDIASFFNMITGYSQPSNWNKIEVAPFGLRRKLLRLIRRETMRSTPEQPGLIRFKLNSLVDSEMIEALYQASRAGVRVQLNVRGICCLQPGIKGLSETIQVISIVDQFLEHSRIYYFANGNDPEVYLSSADLMQRNLDKRIEILFPVDDPACQKRLIDTLEIYFRDTQKSWILLPDGSYARTEPGSRKRLRVQEFLCQRALDEERAARKAPPQELKPQRPSIQP